LAVSSREVNTHCDNLRDLIQVATEVRNVETSLTSKGALRRPIFVVGNTVGISVVGSATEASVNTNASAEAASSKHTVANPNSSASAGTKKVEDELLDDGYAAELYTPMPMDPRVNHALDNVLLTVTI
jgi:hypothetical protein